MFSASTWVPASNKTPVKVASHNCFKAYFVRIGCFCQAKQVTKVWKIFTAITIDHQNQYQKKCSYSETCII